MCGIAGFYQNQFDYTREVYWSIRLHKMRDSLLHRGPDDNGIWMSAHCGLAHTRLAVIDLLCGDQPMQKEHCIISYNGEIYNGKELRDSLKGFPLSWKTSCDTEIILNGYLAYGCEFISRINGIFAFALYDLHRDSLLLARDPLGVKPLFYQQTKDSLVFGSEPKALFACDIRPRLNEESWGEVLGLGPARTPGHGVFADMKELLPGHYLLVSRKGLKDVCYWQLTAAPHTDSYEQTVEKVSFLVTDSIRRQMVSDVPICTFLSGGLDSSLVSAICAREMSGSGKQLQTFSFDFTNNRQNFRPNAFQSSLDRPFVDIMAAHIKSRHTHLECDSRSLADYLLDAVAARDLPCMADIESSMLYFCSRVSKSSHVTLTGECADEIFGGYPWFYRKELLLQHHFPWSYDMRPRLSLLREDFLKENHIFDYALAAYETSLSETPTLYGESGREARQREILWLNVRWFMATLLNRMDRTSMYSGLEARVPYADCRILEYVYNIPWHMKYHNNIPKSLLVEISRPYLPEKIRFRKKNPYPKTYDAGYEKLLADRLRMVLDRKQSPLLHVVDKKKVLAFLNSPKDYGRPWYGQLMAGPQMIAYLLQIDYWMERYHL